MMKNTEWGAVAYLQHSQYGSHESVRINNNEAYITGYASVTEPTCGYTTTNEECNKYESTELGKDGTHTVNYFNSASVVASTTGNITGIYDMSGGAWEFVMGVLLESTNTNPCSGRFASYHSGFNGPYCSASGNITDGVTDFPNQKYYDTYLYSTVESDSYRRILGDATGEMGPFDKNSVSRQIGSWYEDDFAFVFSTWVWFRRGANYNYGTNAGVFAFGHVDGYSWASDSFRIVLTFSS